MNDGDDEVNYDGDNDVNHDCDVDISDYGDNDNSDNDMANLEATGVTGSGNLKCWPTPPLLELLDTPGRAVQGGVFDVTITWEISRMMATSVNE